jgi:hypothetical protein
MLAGDRPSVATSDYVRHFNLAIYQTAICVSIYQ